MEKTKSPGYFASLWPVQAVEYKKFFSMFFMFFLISFNYNTLRAVKDTLVITAEGSGAEAIPFIKLWVLLPSALLFTLFLTHLSNRYGREKAFYGILWSFLIYFILFIAVLYPGRDLLHPYGFCDYLGMHLPKGFNGLIALIRHWTFTSFYVMAELWGAMIMNVLFWGFANDTTPVGQAKRFYSLLGVAANFAGAVGGFSVSLLSKNAFNAKLFFGNSAWEQSVFYVCMMVIVVSFAIILIYRYINRNIVSHDAAVATEPHLPKPKMSLRKNFAYLANSKYLICIALIVVTYNVAINLIEVVWKNQIKLLYPDPSDYNIYISYVITATGVLSTLIAIFLSGNIIRKFSWTYSALIPPIIIAITGIGFFAFFFFKNPGSAMILGFSPLALCVFFGSMQNCISRSLKYTLFDATKEISFIPLSSESKLKGKAAIDGIGAKIGKSGGSIIHQGLLIIFSTLTATTPIVAILFLAIIFIWAGAVKSLGKQFNELVAHNEKLIISEKQPEKIIPVNN